MQKLSEALHRTDCGQQPSDTKKHQTTKKLPKPNYFYEKNRGFYLDFQRELFVRNREATGVHDLLVDDLQEKNLSAFLFTYICMHHYLGLSI